MHIVIPPELEKRIRDYSGNGRELEVALGTYAMGYLFGWRVLYMVNSQKTLRAHQKVLRLNFREVLPERTELSEKSLGLRVADQTKSFWSVIRGARHRDPLPDRADLVRVVHE